MIVPPATFWPLVREVCDRHGVLLIADEVVTGFGRGGAMFGTRLWGVKADLWCLAKGISSGYFPLGAAVVSDEIFNTLVNELPDYLPFLHGYTYQNHPAGCAAGKARRRRSSSRRPAPKHRTGS